MLNPNKNFKCACRISAACLLSYISVLCLKISMSQIQFTLLPWVPSLNENTYRKQPTWTELSWAEQMKGHSSFGYIFFLFTYQRWRFYQMLKYCITQVVNFTASIYYSLKIIFFSPLACFLLGEIDFPAPMISAWQCD